MDSVLGLVYLLPLVWLDVGSFPYNLRLVVHSLFVLHLIIYEARTGGLVFIRHDESTSQPGNGIQVYSMVALEGFLPLLVLGSV